MKVKIIKLDDSVNKDAKRSLQGRTNRRHEQLSDELMAEVVGIDAVQKETVDGGRVRLGEADVLGSDIDEKDVEFGGKLAEGVIVAGEVERVEAILRLGVVGRLAVELLHLADPADRSGGHEDDAGILLPGGTPPQLLREGTSAKDWLSASGINFPEGSSALRNTRARQLIVRNTAAEHVNVQALIEQTVGAAPPDEPLLKRAESIILPHVTISGATVEQALTYLQTKSKDSDRYHEGITLQSRLPEDFVKPAISLDLRDVSLTKALRAVAELAGVRVAETKDALVLEAK